MSMSSPDPIRVVRTRLLIVAALMVVAGLAGWFLAGEIPDAPPELAPAATPATQAAAAPANGDGRTAALDGSGERAAESTASAAELPIGFMPHLVPGVDAEPFLAEVEMAAAAGFRKYLLRVPALWPEPYADGAPENPFEWLDAVVERDANARFFLWIDLNPPAAWLEDHPDAVYTTVDGEHPYASTASAEWRAAAQTALDALFAALREAGHEERVEGVVPAALIDGQWHGPPGLDRSEAMGEDFRLWLTQAYANDEALAAAWGDADTTLAAAELPALPERGELPKVFLDPAEDRAVVDALRHLSESRANAVIEITEHIRVKQGANLTILLPYGYSYELLDPTAGHAALAIAMESSADGFISPVSYANRGLGGTGGFMGPVDSARYRGKRWYLIDDTRTGIEWDAETGAYRPPEGVRIEDIYQVQARNFAAALTHNLGLFWSDANGRPTLHDPAMWERFAELRRVYQTVNLRSSPSGTIPNPRARATVLFVVSEDARFLHRRDAPLAARLLQGARDAVMQSGAPAHFVLLRDVLAGRAAPAEVYVFANAFVLSESDRERLHSVLARDRATAIWLYAPGYFDGDSASVANIRKTVNLPIGKHEGAAQASSRWQIGGEWLARDTQIGEEIEVYPLFYIDDSNARDEVEPMALYRDSGRPSIAGHFTEDGWNSIFVADPVLTAPLLRAFLGILEATGYLDPPDVPIVETTLFGPGIIALHAAEPGERVLRLPTPLNVFDVLDREQGWYNQQTIPMRLDAGQTRILQIQPPEEAPAL